jgi:hypothetical protein
MLGHLPTNKKEIGEEEITIGSISISDSILFSKILA